MKRMLTTIFMFSFLLLSVPENLDIIKPIKITNKIEIQRLHADPGGAGH
ncbi:MULTISPECIES: hypothetical protein [Bacillus]|nr:hypothetical protein [Bacillus thuringiensis]